MRRTEALQGVRMIKFLDVLGRYDAAEFSQLEAAEFLGVESGRFGAGASVLRTTARWVCWIAGSARLVVGVGGNMVEFVHGDKPVVERLDPQFVDCEPEGRMGAGQHLVGTFEERAELTLPPLLLPGCVAQIPLRRDSPIRPEAVFGQRFVMETRSDRPFRHHDNGLFDLPDFATYPTR